IKDTKDVENTVIKERSGTPIYVKNVAAVQVGTGYRRNIFEKDGNDVVGGVVVMRQGENPLAVTERVKKKIQGLQPGLPPGVRIVPAYDRTRLIHGAIDHLTGIQWQPPTVLYAVVVAGLAVLITLSRVRGRSAALALPLSVLVPGLALWVLGALRIPVPWPEGVLWHEMLIASVAILLILVHARSAFVICVTLPLAVLFAFLQMWLLRKLGIIDVQANIMSLAGITISIGILVDQAIVMVENATHHLKE